MKYSTQTPSAIAAEIGSRLKKARLSANISQAEIAKRTGLNRKTILNAEKGKVQLENMIAILVSMDLASQLDMFLPDPGISPIQLAKLKGKERLRASGVKEGKSSGEEDSPPW